ncbi:HIT domain-containing protein [Bordetella genomosp. 13]|uniref:HIT domain-containing protein n=1 Tax=Bordetella genomosp. 13 TaxID=463040 RepID=UPI0011A1D279|nr:HIT domain-containing protein [Bordetella genomosp. 13]
MSDTCIFCKTVRGGIPAKRVCEGGDCAGLHDIRPAASAHLPSIGRRHRVSLQDIGSDDAGWLGKMAGLAFRPAAENGCRPGPDSGPARVADSGVDGGQEVPSLHFHNFGGPQPWHGRVAVNA